VFSLLMDLGKVAGKAIKAGVKGYEDSKGAITEGEMAALIMRECKGWDPKANNVSILTAKARTGLAKGLGVLAYNIAAANAGRGLI
jgi:hypothetical protein